VKRILILACLLCYILLLGCELDDPPIPPTPPIEVDYRTAYLGDFLFYSTSVHRSIGQVYYRDTITYIGYIYAVQDVHNQLMIRYRSGLNPYECNLSGTSFGSYISPTLETDGEMQYAFRCWNASLFTGGFHNMDSLEFRVGMGDSSQHHLDIVHGVRIR
jgi:hypothetical protein